ncbi:MAG TPA: hypothetical protein VK543_10140 [Puia sp.]|nr:hypothetical protein [Puia sp.]
MKSSMLIKMMPVLLLSATLMITMDSCKKDSNNPPNSSTNNDTTAADLSASTTVADNYYDDIFQTAVQTGYDNSIAYKSNSGGTGDVQVNTTHAAESALGTEGVNGCAIYVRTPDDNSTFPKTISVDFGTGCTSTSGVTRKGKITYVFSGKLITPGTTVSATFTNYSVNDYQLQGTYSITNNSSLANGIAFTTKVTGGSIIFPDQRSFTYTGTKTVTQTAGISTTTDPTDDVFSIIGNNSFSANGNTLVNTITTPLSKAYSCKFVGSGIISFTYNTNTKGTLDFGSGGCDGDVIIKVGPYTTNVTFQ